MILPTQLKSIRYIKFKVKKDIVAVSAGNYGGKLGQI